MFTHNRYVFKTCYTVDILCRKNNVVIGILSISLVYGYPFEIRVYDKYNLQVIAEYNSAKEAYKAGMSALRKIIKNT